MAHQHTMGQFMPFCQGRGEPAKVDEDGQRYMYPMTTVGTPGFLGTWLPVFSNSETLVLGFSFGQAYGQVIILKQYTCTSKHRDGRKA